MFEVNHPVDCTALQARASTQQTNITTATTVTTGIDDRLSFTQKKQTQQTQISQRQRDMLNNN